MGIIEKAEEVVKEVVEGGEKLLDTLFGEGDNAGATGAAESDAEDAAGDQVAKDEGAT